MKLENVVKPPRMPTKTNVRANGDSERRSAANAPASTPIASEPIILTAAVAHGTGVLISEYTKQDLTTKTLLREIDLLRVKGKHEPVAIYEAMDHLSEATFPNISQAVERYGDGIRLYRERAFKDARARFLATLALNPADRPSRLYVERCEHFIETPPPSDWDGVWTMTSK